jgi:hypothetical protein
MLKLIQKRAFLLLKSASIQEKIIQRKVIFFKPAFDVKSIRKHAESAKNQMFKKYFFLKSKPEESEINILDKYFEPYVVIDGKYSIDYSKNWEYSIQVDEEMQTLKINHKNFEPKLLNNQLAFPYKQIELNGIARFHHEERKRIVFDQKWNEVRLDLIPYLPFEEETQILNEEVQQLSKNLANEKEVKVLKSKIFKRPQNLSKIHNELFVVTDRALIFKPMYEVTATHIKTQKKVTFKIDGVNGKIVADGKVRINTFSTTNLKKVSKLIYSKSKEKIQQVYDYATKTGKRLYQKKTDGLKKKSTK